MTVRSSTTATLIFTTTAVVIIATSLAFVWKLHRDDKNRPDSISPSDWRSFRAAIRTLHTTRNRVPLHNGDRLILYALYKQTTVGNAPNRFVPRPEKDLLQEQAQWSSWCDVRDMDRTVALQHYVKAVKEFTSEEYQNNMEEDADDEDGLGAGAAAVSRPLMTEEDATSMIDTTTPQGQLLKAARDNEIDQLRSLIVSNTTVDLNSPDAAGQTALHLASDRGHVDCVQLLLSSKPSQSSTTTRHINVNAVDIDGISVLQTAVIAGRVETVRLLLEAGADPDLADQDGDTPRSCAMDDPQLVPLFATASTTTTKT